MADELKARLSVDTGDFGPKIAQAMAQAKVATDNLSESMKRYGLDAAAGVQSAIDALAKDIAAMDAAKAAVAALRAEQDKLNTSVSHTVSTMAAASGEIRLFEGNIPIRAVENFAAKTLGLGPIMQAAFPVAGAIAAASIIFGVGEKLYNMESKALHAGQAFAEAFDGMHDKALITNDDLRIQDDKLRDEIAKLSGKPGDGLQTAIDESIKRADQLLVSLKADHKEIEAIFNANGVGKMASIFSGVASTGKQQEEVEADGKAMQRVVAEANAKYAAAVADAKTPEALKKASADQAAAIKLAFQTRIDAYAKEAARLKKEQSDSEKAAAAAVSDSHGESAGGPTVDNSAKISSIEGVTSRLRDQLETQLLVQKAMADTEKLGQMKHDKTPKGGADKADELRLRSDEEGRDAEKQTGATDETQRGLLSANADRDYWQARIAAYKTGGEQYKVIVQKITQDEIAIQKQAAEFKRSQMAEAVATQNLSPEAANKGIADFNKLNARAAEEAQKAQERLNAENARGAEIAAQVKASMDLVNIGYREQTGQISAVTADIDRAGVHLTEYDAKLRALKVDLDNLKKDGEGLDPNSAAGKENQGKQQAVKNQMASVQGQKDTTVVQDADKIKRDIAAPYLSAYKEITTSFMQMQNAMLTGRMTFSQAMKQTEQQLAMYAINQLEMQLVKHGAVEVEKLAQHMGFLTAKKGADTVDATTTAAIQAAAKTAGMATTITTNIATIMSLAAVASAAAFASTAAIPVVGVAAAPEAAAAAYAAVAAMSAMAAFETGTSYVPSTGIAMIHEGEQVVNKRNNDELMSLARGGAGGGSKSATFHNTMHYHSHGGGGKTDARQAAKMMQKQVLRAHAVMS